MLADLEVLIVGELLVDRDRVPSDGGPPLENCEFENGSVTYENTRFGAPPLPVTYLPLTTIEPVAWIWPSDRFTPSTAGSPGRSPIGAVARRLHRCRR